VKTELDSNFRRDLERFILDNYATSSYGMNISIVVGEKDEFSYSVGSIPELHFKFSRNTVFDLASLTKPIITATLIMMSVERGLISMEDNLEILGLYSAEEPVSGITIRNLLTHTSGLIPTFPLYKFGHSRDDYIRTISLLHTRLQIGVREEYSDLNFILLGFILENLYGRGLDRIADEMIFKRIGMHNSYFNPALKKTRIAPTEVDQERGLIWGKVHDEKSYYLGGIAGHAGMFSTIGDIEIFMSNLLKGKVVNNRTLEMMISNKNRSFGGIFGYGWMIKVERPDNPSNSYGYSGFMGDVVRDGAFGHTGFTGCSVCVDPSSRSYVIIMSNRVYPTRNNNNIIRFRRLFHNLVFNKIYSIQ